MQTAHYSSKILSLSGEGKIDDPPYCRTVNAITNELVDGSMMFDDVGDQGPWMR